MLNKNEILQSTFTTAACWTP